LNIFPKTERGINPTKETALALLDTVWSTAAYESKSHEREDRATAEACSIPTLPGKQATPITFSKRKKDSKSLLEEDY